MFVLGPPFHVLCEELTVLEWPFIFIAGKTCPSTGASCCGGDGVEWLPPSLLCGACLVRNPEDDDGGRH